MADQGGRHLRIEDHRHLGGLHPPGAQPAQGALGGGAADRLRGVQVGALARGVIPAVPLHLAVRGGERRGGQAEGGRAVLAGEAVAGRVGVARVTVAEVPALGVGDARVEGERGPLAASRQVDLRLGGEIVSARIVQAEVAHGAREAGGIGEAGQGIGRGDARERDRLVHQALERVAREIRRGGGGGGAAHEDAQGEVLVAGMLDGVHLPHPHLGREGLVLDHEGVGLGGALAAGPLEDVAQEVEQGPAQTWVPPTVIPSMRIVGSPTPTGTDWPSLPQVPTPSSRARSPPTRLTRVRASGPFPMRVAPLTGAVTRPPSMR